MGHAGGDAVASRAEALGYASLWTFQRVLHPVARDLGPAHQDVHDSVVALAYVAAHTERIGLGTATICAPFIAPGLLAKATASLDVLSGGRLTVGLGLGWLPEEYTAANVPYERRGPRMDEYLRCLHALWTDDPVEFAGEFYAVDRSHVGPRPLQRPHPPVLLGGTSAPLLRRAGQLAQVFFDLNLSPRVVSPGVEVGDVLAYAERVLDAFAPATLTSSRGARPTETQELEAGEGKPPKDANSAFR